MSKTKDINRLEQFYVLDNEDQSLRNDVRLLGTLLGETIRYQPERRYLTSLKKSGI